MDYINCATCGKSIPADTGGRLFKNCRPCREANLRRKKANNLPLDDTASERSNSPRINNVFIRQPPNLPEPQDTLQETQETPQQPPDTEPTTNPPTIRQLLLKLSNKFNNLTNDNNLDGLNNRLNILENKINNILHLLN